jgi:flagellar biosynthetic protein FlhB
MFSSGGAQVWWPLVKGLIALSLMVIGVKMFVEMIYDGVAPISAALLSSAPSVVGFAVFAILDFLLQVWRRNKSLGMSLQELKDEFKESEGDPLIKSKMRAIARQRSRSRMMAAIATADVVVVNPEHYLVALAWRSKKATAPIVVARARDLIAQSLKERARALDIPVLEAPPFARALWATTKIDEPIPLSYYESVATLLAWAYAMKDGKAVVEPNLSAPIDAVMEGLNA